MWTLNIRHKNNQNVKVSFNNIEMAQSYLSDLRKFDLADGFIYRENQKG